MGLSSVLTTIVAAAILLLCFTRLQLRHGRDALLDLHLFRIPTFSAAMLLSFTGRLVTFGLLPYLIFWLSGRQHLSPVQVGFVLLALALPMVVIAAPSSALGHGNHVTGGAMSVTAIGLLWLGLALGSDATWARALGPLFVIGIGSGAAMPHMMNLALAVVPASRAGAATGAANTAFPLGTPTGVAVFGAPPLHPGGCPPVGPRPGGHRLRPLRAAGADVPLLPGRRGHHRLHQRSLAHLLHRNGPRRAVRGRLLHRDPQPGPPRGLRAARCRGVGRAGRRAGSR